MNRARRACAQRSVGRVLVSILEHEMNRARRIVFVLGSLIVQVSILEHEMNRARRCGLASVCVASQRFNPRARNESCPTP